MTSKTDKIRSVILTLLMVASVFAGSVAFAGTAAAAHAGDAHAHSGSSFWAGQQLAVDATDEAPSDDWRLYPVESDGTVGTTVEDTIQFGNDYNSTIDTSGLEGSYVVANSSGNLVEFDSGVATVTGTHKSDGAGTETFSVTQQNMDGTALDSDTVQQGTTANIELDSNRGTGGYDLLISSEDLTTSEIEALTGYTANDDGDVFTDDVPSTIDLSTGADGIETGTYNITVEAADTGASATVTLTVEEAGDTVAEFTNDGVFTDERGDVVTVTAALENSDNATIQVGTPSVGFNITGNAIDTDEDGEVSILVNTYTNNISGASGTTWQQGEDETRPAVGEPIDAGDYELQVGVDGVGDEADNVGSLILNDRSTGEGSSAIAPGSVGDEWEDVSSYLGAPPTDGDTVAEGDYVVASFEGTSGIYGLLNNASNNVTNASAEGLSLSIAQTSDSTPPNTNPKHVEVDGSAVSLLPDSTNNTLYVVVDTEKATVNRTTNTNDETVGFSDGDAFDVTLDLWNDELIPSDVDNETATSTFTVVDPEATIDVNGDDVVQVTNGEDQTVSGTSTLAPGSELRVKVKSSGSASNPFLFTQTAEVSEDGSWEATFDFSDAEVEQEFTVSVSNFDDVSADGKVVEDVGTPTPTPTTTATPTPTPTPTPTTEEPTPTPTEESDDEPEPTATPEDGQPGFGVVVALLAMLGAALLAARRFE